MSKLRFNLNWRLGEGEASSASHREKRSLWDIAGVRSWYQAEPLREMQLLSRCDPVETQKMLDMAG